MDEERLDATQKFVCWVIGLALLIAYGLVSKYAS